MAKRRCSQGYERGNPTTHWAEFRHYGPAICVFIEWSASVEPRPSNSWRLRHRRASAPDFPRSVFTGTVSGRQARWDVCTFSARRRPVPSPREAPRLPASTFALHVVRGQRAAPSVGTGHRGNRKTSDLVAPVEGILNIRVYAVRFPRVGEAKQFRIYPFTGIMSPMCANCGRTLYTTKLGCISGPECRESPAGPLWCANANPSNLPWNPLALWLPRTSMLILQ